MAERVRLNKVIELLQQGQPVFSCGTVMSGNYDELQVLSRSDYDLVIVETRLEQGFRIIMTPPVRSMARLHRGREASGRTRSA